MIGTCCHACFAADEKKQNFYSEKKNQIAEIIGLLDTIFCYQLIIPANDTNDLGGIVYIKVPPGIYALSSGLPRPLDTSMDADVKVDGHEGRALLSRWKVDILPADNCLEQDTKCYIAVQKLKFHGRQTTKPWFFKFLVFMV